MRLMGLQAIYQAPRTSAPHPAHRVYPYLLKGLAIDRPNQVWCADITYIPVQRGFLYLVVVMDWATRPVLDKGHQSPLTQTGLSDLDRHPCQPAMNFGGNGADGASLRIVSAGAFT